MEEKTEYLKKLPFFGQLSDGDKKMIEDGSAIKKYEKGRIIHGGTEECLGQILLIEGELRTYIISEEGREITLFRLYPDDAGILTASCVISQITFDTQVITEKDSKMLVINSGVFSKVAASNVYVRCYMYELLTERFSSVMWTMQQILFLGFDRRLATFLMSEYEKTGKKEIKMTHEQIAAETNSAREVVARMLKRFASDGLVEYKRGSVVILNTAALADMAESSF